MALLASSPLLQSQRDRKHDFYHLVFVEHFQMKKVPVTVDLTCQCNYIWNQLKPTLPGVPASNFINRDYLKQEDPS